MNAHPADAAPLPPEPTRWSGWVFRFKASCFQMRRLIQDTTHPVTKHPQGNQLWETPVTADWSSDLWRGGESPRERKLQLGKVQNLRIAAQALNGVEIPAGATWSFWKHLGRTTKAKGYSTGRELREGCLIPQIGGGLCQLSGAIYNAALEAGLEIVERHAHSNSSVGSLARIGRDATIFWNYVDLRLRHEAAWRLEVHVSQDKLHVCIRSNHHIERPVQVMETPGDSRPPNACATCGLASCHRSSPLENAQQEVDRTAVLVDAWWPEWDAFLKSEKGSNRDLFLPLDGKRWKKASYQWDTALHAKAFSFPSLTLMRSWATRRLRNEGARRQRALLHWDERLAAAYGQALKAHHSHLIVSQTLLPYLWKKGWLGGRTFDVMMCRLPMLTLHERLDEAARLHPESGTCADFRAEQELVQNETAALAAATRWITPHTEIAKLAGCKAHLIPWSLPESSKAHTASGLNKNVVFPASTLCRKGAYELRKALHGLPVKLELRGGVLEGADFWDGIHLTTSGDGWLEQADIIVLPAFVENCPRVLLKAVAAGKPVIATEACGIEGLPGVTIIQAGDAQGLRLALIKQLSASGNSARWKESGQPSLRDG
ncbi:glycosyl transferase family 1 [Prosthecobacter fusiformis]|uniref:Glycosyl transferase family 1 n=1 Tax=Prosthecobacter fusiformis TaxID=48464 RepID=A0A4R7SRN7_9BACT|nr:VanW family protein [Prosthecobacter fusiformis]TDU81289.1 glycosyl transferase family 1 [Prosthecobacter fusiformis]